MLRETIITAIKKAAGEVDVDLETPDIEEYGDYSTNVAMTTFENAKLQMPNAKWRSPSEYAKVLVGKLQTNKELAEIVDKIEVAGSGFINFWLKRMMLVKNMGEVLRLGEKYGSSGLGVGKTVVIDYSSPNTAKSFGIGHLRSTVIGQALYNLYKFLGYKVVGDNHIGDWGTQFGTLLYQINHQQLTIDNLTIDALEKLYIDFHKKAEEDPVLWDEARAWFRKLEEGDSQSREIWQKISEISFAEFNRIYKLLGVKIDYVYGESFYQDKMPDVIKELDEKGLTKKSQGALIVEFPHSTSSGQTMPSSVNPEPAMPPAMAVKSDGTTTYFTRDLATIKFRIGEWNPDIFIYEVGSDQILHFRQVFATAKLLGWNDVRHYEHVAHGLIRFPGGKMSTRGGKTVKLEDVLDEAIKRARQIIDKSETSRGLSESEKREVSEAVGIGSVKYFDLKHHPSTDIIFDWDKIFVLEGNSAPYIQYTVARTNSVLAKIKNQNSKIKITNQNSKLVINDEELKVLRSLVRFSDVIVGSAKNYSPNLLVNYLFDLAQKYNNFYNEHRIIGEENEEFRLALTQGVGQILKNGLGILGIGTPEKM